MPIVKNENGTTSIQYHIPAEWTARIDSNFIDTFCKELSEINWNWTDNEDSFPRDNIMVESTLGWGRALKCTCLRTANEDLWKYYNQLDWYDSDLFDGELTDLCFQFKYGDEWEVKYQAALDYWYPPEEEDE